MHDSLYSQGIQDISHLFTVYPGAERSGGGAVAPQQQRYRGTAPGLGAVPTAGA